MTRAERFGEFALLQRIDRDAIGELFRAATQGPQGLDRLLLLRVYEGPELPLRQLSPRSQARGAVLGLLHHPFIGEGIEHGEVGGVAFSAYDFVPGRTLATFLERSAESYAPPTPDIAVLVVDRLAQALKAAAERSLGGHNIIHGCIIPQLVLVANEGEVKLLGFEVGPELRGLLLARSTSPLRAYLCPEAQAEHRPTPQEDVFSLGAMLYQILTGKAPTAELAASPGTTLAGARLAEDGTPVPSELRELLESALGPATGRPATPGAFLDTLTSCRQKLGYAAGPFQLADLIHSAFGREEEEGPKAKPQAAPAAPAAAPPATSAAVATSPVEHERAAPQRRSLAPVVAFAAAAVIAIIAGVLYFTRGTTPAPPPPVAAAAPTAAPEPDPVAPAMPSLEEQLQAQVDGLIAERASSNEDLQRRYDEQIEALRSQIDSARQAIPVAPVTPTDPDDEAQESGGEASQEEATPEPADASEAAAEIPPERTPPASSGTSTPAASKAGAGADRGKTPPAQPGTSAATPVAAPTTAPPASTDTPKARSTAKEPTAGSAGQVVVQTEPPKLLSFARPEYPSMARRLKTEGDVVLSLLIDEQGKVAEVRFLRRISRDVGLNEAAEQAARNSTFSPARKNGKPVQMWYTLTVPFRLR